MTTTVKRVKILIVDDHKMIRDGIRLMLESQENCKYKFKFSLSEKKIDAAIHLLNQDESTRLITWVKGDVISVNELTFSKIFFNYGWITPLVVFRIHYQAVKLFFKKVKFYSKPELPENIITRGDLL